MLLQKNLTVMMDHDKFKMFIKYKAIQYPLRALCDHLRRILENHFSIENQMIENFEIKPQNGK